METVVRIGLIGTGRAGMIHAGNMAHRVREAEITCVSDVDENSAASAARELECDYVTDYINLLKRSDVDAVIIAVPTKFHREIAVAAAKMGKHIFCEKPMAMNREECLDMIRAADENHVILQIGFMRRFDESFRRAKEIVLSGSIGEVVMVKSLTHGPSTPHEWMYDIAKSNGPLSEVNSHDIDTLRWMTGGEVESVYAIAGNYRCGQVKEIYPDFYDSVLMSVKMDNGMMGCIDGAQGVEYGYDARVDIVGTKGLITVGDLRAGSTITYTKSEGLKGDVVRSWTDLFSEAYMREDESFARSILENREPEVTGWDGMMAVEVVRAGNESIRTGHIVLLQVQKQKNISM